jgi:predicted dienelactone hydrolase
MMRSRSSKAFTRTCLAAVTALTLSVTAAAPASIAADNPYQRGPAPTASSLAASRGPFATSQTTVSRFSVSGFGGGTIYYPTSTSEGTFGALAMSPGYTASQSSIAWFGPRLASHGFVVIIIDTNSRYDQPASRGTQLLAALDYLTRSSSVRSRIDSSRLAVAGHSMGGGGTLEAAEDRPSLQAAIPLAPWNLDKNWSGNRVPTLIIGGSSDTIAPPASHSIPFYTSLPSTPDKAYLELRGASHFFPQTANTTVATATVSWLKRFVDDDTRYDAFLCPGPSGTAVSQYRNTCPLD